MSFFEFVEQIAFIIKNLPISFWISVAIVSPLFMKFEGLVQTGLTKILYFVFIRFPKKYPKLLSFLGFSSQNMYQQLQELHGQYENEKNISEKKYKVCLEYHLGNCLGGCELKQTKQDYDKGISEIKEILKDYSDSRPFFERYKPFWKLEGKRYTVKEILSTSSYSNYLTFKTKSKFHV